MKIRFILLLGGAAVVIAGCLLAYVSTSSPAPAALVPPVIPLAQWEPEGRQMAREPGLPPQAEEPAGRQGGPDGSAEAQPVAPPQESDSLLVAVPAGADVSGLEIAEWYPLLRLPASLAMADPSRLLHPFQKAQKEAITRQFLSAVAAARRTTADPASLVAEWMVAQQLADGKLRELVGAGDFRQQFEAVNPEINERAAALRRARQAQIIEEAENLQLMETLAQPAQPTQPETVEQRRARLQRMLDEAGPWRREQQRRLIGAGF